VREVEKAAQDLEERMGMVEARYAQVMERLGDGFEAIKLGKPMVIED
jgi:hypothetical protein